MARTKFPTEIIVKWSWEDAKAMYPHWTKEEAIQAMDEVEGYVHERIVELGNEVLEQVLYEMVEIERETEEEEE
jgi:hypothetical protein